MNLVEKIIKLDEIMIDPNNPRFPEGHKNKDQNDIIELALNDKSAKELLNSLNTCVRWVNKIVVMKTVDYSKTHKDLNKFKYIAVEGNTRLACLKSGNVSNYNKSSKIPILIAEKEVNESVDQYQDAILITQGIANVMVVKEWDQIAKAKHIYNLFESKNKLGENLNAIISQISTELGMKKPECKKHIQRYTIFKKIDDEDRTLDKSEWGYLEAFDVNPATRNFIGLSEDMTWDEEKSDEVIPFIGDLILKATKEVGHTKKFRDYVKKLIEDTSDREDVINKFQSFVDEHSEENLINAIDEISPESSEEDWKKKIKSVSNVISDFPANKDWANSLQPQLKKLEENIKTLTKMIELKN